MEDWHNVILLRDVFSAVNEMRKDFMRKQQKYIIINMFIVWLQKNFFKLTYRINVSSQNHTLVLITNDKFSFKCFVERQMVDFFLLYIVSWCHIKLHGTLYNYVAISLSLFSSLPSTWRAFYTKFNFLKKQSSHLFLHFMIWKFSNLPKCHKV